MVRDYPWHGSGRCRPPAGGPALGRGRTTAVPRPERREARLRWDGYEHADHGSGARGLEILHLSSVIKRPLVDATGDRLGRVQDLIVRAGESPHPPVVGLVVDIGGRDLFVPIRKVAAFEPGRVAVRGAAGGPAALRAPAGRAAAGPGPAGPPPDQLRGRPAHPGQRDRAGQGQRHLGGGGRRPVAADRCCAASSPAAPAGGQARDHRGLGQHRALRGPRADVPAPDPLPQAGQAPPGPDRRPGRGGLPRRGRGDHRGGGGRPRARGRRLRGARHRAPAGVRPQPVRRRGGPAALLHGPRRRRRPDHRGRPGAAAARSSTCCPNPSSARSGRCSATTPRRPAA